MIIDFANRGGGGATTWDSITNKPTTISGYGITDAYTSAQTNSAITTAITDKVSSATITTIWKGTQAEYDAIVTKSNNTMYVIV